MSVRVRKRVPAALRSLAVVAGTVVVGGGLFAWKFGAGQGAAADMAQVEPAEVVTAAVAEAREHRNTTTSIGTVLATRSITLRNEVPGTVRSARLVPGQVVEQGAVLVALDVSVELAELKALEARAELAQTTLERQERMAQRRAVSAMDLDNARAARDVALAEIERTRAIIERKTIRAPFRARVGIADVHVGQFLETGALLTTLQGVGDDANVDFAVAQAVAAGLRAGDVLEVFSGPDESVPVAARIVAVDARVDPATRNATVRARIEDARALAPGASVRVRVPTGAPQRVVVVPVSALRKGPQGDHVFVLGETAVGQLRAAVRPVRAGPVLGDEVAILDGVAAGERLAATGSFKLRDGALVSVAPDTPKVTAAR